MFRFSFLNTFSVTQLYVLKKLTDRKIFKVLDTSHKSAFPVVQDA